MAMDNEKHLIGVLEKAGYLSQYPSTLASILIKNGMEIPVHCCDCQNCTVLIREVDGEPLLFCEHWKGHPMVDPTDYCSHGERKGNAV